MKTKQIIIILALILTKQAYSSEYKVSLDEKHYANAISISEYIKTTTPITPQENIDYTSCKTILDTSGSTGSGNYTLTDGYDVFCDMVTNGGGWTLLITEGAGANGWSQFSSVQTGTPLNDDYRSSDQIYNQQFTEILWFNHPNSEYTVFTQKDNSPLIIDNIPASENTTYIFKATSGQQRTANSYYNLISAPSFGDTPSPMLMFSGSDEFGDEFGGADYGKAYNNWEGDVTSWYYRFSGSVGGLYSGNPWKENGHQVVSEKLQSFFIR